MKMMKKKRNLTDCFRLWRQAVLSVMLCVVASAVAVARPISQEQARQRAVQFMSHQGDMRALAPVPHARLQAAARGGSASCRERP